MRQTTDGGAHWLRRDTSATNSDLTAIDMADASNGWAIGPVGLAHTTDGGATWTSQDCGAGSDKLLTVSAIDASNAWVGGEWGLLRRTTDGGATWQSYDRSVDDGNVNSVQFINSSTGWVGCAYAGFHTTDGGASWTWDDLPGSCVFTDANDGWGCSYAHVGRTTDGGASWSYTVLPGAYYTISDVAFGDPEHGIAVCKYAVPCQAWRTDDGGATWTAIDWAAQNLAVTPNFDRIAVVGTSAWCFGGTTVLHTGDRRRDLGQRGHRPGRPARRRLHRRPARLGRGRQRRHPGDERRRRRRYPGAGHDLAAARRGLAQRSGRSPAGPRRHLRRAHD